MVKRHTKKNRNLKGGGCNWHVKANGDWFAQPDGAKKGTAMMMNAIISLLGQEEFKRLYNEKGGARAVGGAPTAYASSEPFLRAILKDIKTAISEADDDDMEVAQLIEAMERTTAERAEDLSGTHGDRGLLERTLQREFYSAAGVAVAGGSEGRKTLNKARNQLKTQKSKRGVQIDLMKVRQNGEVADEIQRRRAVMELSNCDRYVKGEGKCNMRNHKFSCPAQRGRDAGFHDKQLRDKYSYFNKQWKTARSGKKKQILRNEMMADLTDGEKASVPSILAKTPGSKMRPAVWLQAKTGCSVDDRLSRRGWRGNAEEAFAIRENLFAPKKAVFVVGSGSGSGGSSDAYGGKKAGYEKEGILIPGQKYYIEGMDASGERRLTIDDHDGGFESIVTDKGLPISQWAKPKGYFKDKITYIIPKEQNALLDAGQYDVFLDSIRQALLGRKQYKKFKTNKWSGGKRKRKTRKRIRRRTRKRRRKTKKR